MGSGLVPNRRFRERFELLARVDGLSQAELAHRLGYRAADGRLDARRVGQQLGLATACTARRRPDGRRVARHREFVSYETAVKLCRALNLDPHEVDL